jgi:hypothetical protein
VIMAIVYRIARWLDWSGAWTARMPHLPISKIRFCEIWIVAGSIMTLSVGPWLGALCGAVAVSICRASNRRRAIALLIAIVTLVGVPAYSAFKAYVSVDLSLARASGDRLQEDSAYRNKLLPLYIPIIEENPTWGWGRNAFPVLDGMESIDNGYLLTALTFGVYALGLLVAILIWTPLRLAAFSQTLRRGDPAALAAFSLIGIYVMVTIATGTVWLGGETIGRFFFVIGAWSAGLLNAPLAETADSKPIVSRTRAQYAYRRVMV